MNLDSELFNFLAFHLGLLMLKMMCMSFWTSKQRTVKAVAATPEDLMLLGPRAKIDLTDPDVERIRRAHRNDLENIVPFVIIASLYITTDPDVNTTKTLIRMFTGARIVHSIVYGNAVSQPWRGLVWLVGQGVSFFMLFTVLFYYA